jgi:hypothetical protein
MSQAKVPLRVTAAEYRRSQGQRQAQRNGAGWENVFQGHAARSGVLCLRFPNGCKTIPGPGGRPRLIRVRTPFDWILSHQGKAGFVDTKSTTSLTFTYTQVSDHQLAALRALEMQGHVCGYVVFFQKLNVVVFFRAHQLVALEPRDSLRPEQGLVVGTLLELDVKRLFTHE